jgi:hypothetical protein
VTALAIRVVTLPGSGGPSEAPRLSAAEVRVAARSCAAHHVSRLPVSLNSIGNGQGADHSTILVPC